MSSDPYGTEPPAAAFLGSRRSGVRPNEETINLLPPSCDGRVSWLRCENLVRDWIMFTAVDTARQGPLPKNRLVEDAAMYRELLDNENSQIQKQEWSREFSQLPTRLFLERWPGCFLYRFLSHRRGNGEFVTTFISKFDVLLRRLRESWEDTAPEYTQASTRTKERLRGIIKELPNRRPSCRGCRKEQQHP